MKVASRADRWKGERLWTRIENLLSLLCWTLVGLCKRWSPLAESEARDWLENLRKCCSNNTFPNLSVFALLTRNVYFLPVGANLPRSLITSLLLLILPLELTFYKTLSVLNITMKIDSLFLPRAALLFIYLLLKPLSAKLLTPPFADKKNLCTLYSLKIEY